MSSCHPLSHQSWHQNTSKSLNLPKSNINRSTLFWFARFRVKTGLNRTRLNFYEQIHPFLSSKREKKKVFKGAAHRKIKIEIVCSSSCRNLAMGKAVLEQRQRNFGSFNQLSGFWSCAFNYLMTKLEDIFLLRPAWLFSLNNLIFLYVRQAANSRLMRYVWDASSKSAGLTTYETLSEINEN